MHQIFKPRYIPFLPTRIKYIYSNSAFCVRNRVFNKYLFHTTQQNFLRIPEPPKKIVRQSLTAIDDDVTEMEILTLSVKVGQLVKEFEKVVFFHMHSLIE